MSEAMMEELGLDVNELREAIREEYEAVATRPEQGFHFHTGRTLAEILEYGEELLDGIPEGAIESFSGTGNPFGLERIPPGSNVVDVGSGAGIDSLIASRQVGPEGRVIGVDMTPEMLAKARGFADIPGFENVEFRQSYVESLPVEDSWADVVISNGMINLCPDKAQVYGEALRVLKPGGRLQIADILVSKAVSDGAKQNIDLWKG